MSDYRDLKKYCYLSHHTDSALKEISIRLHAVYFSAGTEIIKEHTPANAYYLIREGEAEFFQKTKSGQKAKISAVGHAGGFGEYRWRAEQRAFKRLLSRCEHAALKGHDPFLKTINMSN